MINQKNRQDFVRSAVENYYDDVYRFCRYYTGNAQDSYDITQEVFLRFMKYAGSCSHKNLKGYLITAARNLCCDYFRSRAQKRDTTFSLDTSDMAERTEIRAASDQTIENCDNELFLQQLLQSIPQEQREVVILRIHDGLKFKEIAKITGCSLPTAKSRFRLGIANMRKVV